MLDPKLRQREEVVEIRSMIDPNTTNAALVAMWEKAWGGDRMGKDTFSGYKLAVEDARLYFRRKDGSEIPVRDWSTHMLWDYFQYVERNYCASFRQVSFGKTVPQAVCLQGAWKGQKEAADAVQSNCKGCPLFKRPQVEHRVNGLAHWFRHLTLLGAIPHNVMLDVREARKGQRASHDRGERRRNPTRDEMRTLVNGTAHPQRRAFYACSAKWYFRPNEMFALDRYASFGLPMPEGYKLPRGFDTGFPAHPELAAFDAGGDMVYVPRKVNEQGVEMKDKRKGNRWMVIDSEIRPILEQHFAWWEMHVKRDEQGRPVTTSLWLNLRGEALSQESVNDSFFEPDTLRLGLVTRGELNDPLRVWTAHCQRHHGERISVEEKIPDVWAHHFRGDKLPTARGAYFRPEPLAVRAAYLAYMPRIGFHPLADAPRMRDATELETHRSLLARMREAAANRNGGNYKVRLIQAGAETWTVPAQLVPSVLHALRRGRPEADAPRVLPHTGPRQAWLTRAALVDVCERALGLLSDVGSGEAAAAS